MSDRGVFPFRSQHHRQWWCRGIGRLFPAGGAALFLLLAVVSAAAGVVLRSAHAESAGQARPLSAPAPAPTACGNGDGSQERIVAALRKSLERVQAAGASIRAQRDEMETALAKPGAQPALLDLYRELRLQQERLEEQGAKFQKLLDEMCGGADGKR